MKDDLFKYMERRFSQKPPTKEISDVRSFVTISRQCGCFGNSVATILIDKLNSEQGTGKPIWKLINKEIIEESSRKLSVDRKLIEEVFNMQKQGVLEDFFHALTPGASLSDIKIRRTIKEVILNYAMIGGHVIVGRGGAVITQDLPNGIHIRMEAREKWRVEQLASRMDLTYAEARKKMLAMDYKREKFKEMFKKSPDEIIQYDLILNNERINVYEASELIYHLMKLRNHLE